MKQHTHLTAQHVELMLVHGQQVTTVVEDLAGIGANQADDILDHDGLTRSASTDNQIGLAIFKQRADVFQDGAPVERFDNVLYFDHTSFPLLSQHQLGQNHVGEQDHDAAHHHGVGAGLTHL